MKSLQFKHESNQIVNQRYQIIDILGEGGIGITYQALNLETQQKVALKVVSLKQHKNWKTIELFEREAEVLKKLSHQFSKLKKNVMMNIMRKFNTNCL